MYKNEALVIKLRYAPYNRLGVMLVCKKVLLFSKDSMLKNTSLDLNDFLKGCVSDNAKVSDNQEMIQIIATIA